MVLKPSKFIVSSILLLLTGCKTDSVSFSNQAQTDNFKQQVNSALSNVVKDEQLRKLVEFEVPTPNHLKIDRNGESVLGFHLSHKTPKLNNGVRSEISIDFPFRAGEIVVYEWSFLMPVDFQHDAPKNRWWSLAQWHDQPNRHKNEDWNGFPSRSPPVAFYYGHEAGKDYLQFKYLNHKDSRADLIPITKGKWQKIRVELKWSQESTGLARVYANDSKEPVIVKNGPNMHNDFQHYLKLGMYRHPGIDTYNTLYVKDIYINKIQ